jgi:membrane protease subunit (stomatin/prohibitin family)
MSQLRSVIQWDNPSPSDFFIQWTADGDEIKNASKLLVGPGQGCMFVYEGQVEGVYTEPGLVELSTANHPFMTTLSKFMQGFKSEHKVGLWFFRMGRVLDQKWGTPSVIKYTDPKYNFPVGLRAFGNYSLHIQEPKAFFTQVVMGARRFSADDFRELMGSRIIQPLADFLASAAYSYADIDKERNNIASGLGDRLSKEFADLGFVLEDFRIEGTSFDEETMKRINRIADMNAEAQAAAAAGLSYAQLQQLDAMKAAAANPSGVAGLGMGLGAGAVFGQMMAGQTAAAPSAASAADPMAKLAQLKKMLEAGLIEQAEYDAKKKDILAQI